MRTKENNHSNDLNDLNDMLHFLEHWNLFLYINLYGSLNRGVVKGV